MALDAVVSQHGRHGIGTVLGFGVERHVLEDRSRSGGSVLHLVVVCVELRRVSGLRALVVKRSRAVCCAGWLGCGRRVALLGRCDIARGGLVRWGQIGAAGERGEGCQGGGPSVAGLRASGTGGCMLCDPGNMFGLAWGLC